MNEVNTIIRQQLHGITVHTLVTLSIIVGLIFGVIFLARRVIVKKHSSFATILLLIVGTIYLCVLFYITLGSRELGSRDAVRLIPFSSIIKDNGSLNLFAFVLMMLNIILFVPYGFLRTCLQGKSSSRWSFVIVFFESLFLSTMIEVIQRITKLGYFELEDIICNTVGGIMGWIMASVMIYVYRRYQEKTGNSFDF